MNRWRVGWQMQRRVALHRAEWAKPGRLGNGFRR
jgi:hypothetical protein